MWMKTEDVGVKADDNDRLLDDFEGHFVIGGEGEDLFEILERVICPMARECERIALLSSDLSGPHSVCKRD
jgi:hypothetical protein